MAMPREPQGENTDKIRERNKAAVRRILEAFNTGNTRLIDQVSQPAVLDYDTCPGLENIGGTANIKQQVTMLREQFPDLHFEEELIIAEGNMVFMRWRLTGTHKGSLFGRPPTGKQISHHGHEIVMLDDKGLILEHIDTNDILKFTDQLGLLDAEMMKTLDQMGVRTYTDDAPTTR